MFIFLFSNLGLRRRFGCIPLFASLVCASWAMAPTLQAESGQTASAPTPDVIVFANGDQLTGKLLRVANGTVTFHSDVAGDINVKWDKVKSIRTAQQFAVIQNGQKIERRMQDHKILQGNIDIQDQQVSVTPIDGGGAKTVPVANAQYLVDEPTYLKDVKGHLKFTQGWTGSITAGASQVEATQNSQTFTAVATGVRTVPNVSWLSPLSRTIFNFNASYGSVSAPNTITTKTNIIHGDGEQDWYFSDRLYALAVASFDHNYSQGLDLQQIYGGGLGVVAYKTTTQELDLKGDLHYERQSFGFTPGVVPPVVTPSKNLVGIDAGDTYVAKLPYKMVFNQGLAVTPAFNDVKAFSATFIAGLSFPAYKRFSFTLGLLDDFLNDPAVGSKRNSFQYTAGVTYSFQSATK